MSYGEHKSFGEQKSREQKSGDQKSFSRGGEQKSRNKSPGIKSPGNESPSADFAHVIFRDIAGVSGFRIQNRANNLIAFLFFLITRTMFTHSRSEKFSSENMYVPYLFSNKLNKKEDIFPNFTLKCKNPNKIFVLQVFTIFFSTFAEKFVATLKKVWTKNS